MWKRWTICLLQGHRWATVPYPNSEGSTGRFLRCLRCGYENHKGAGPRPTGAGL